MKAIIPAAGVGRRLRPLTNTQPKALIQVADRPLIGHILSLVRDAGVQRVVLIMNPEGHAILDYGVRNFPELQFEGVIQDDPQGLGHAVWLTRDVAGRDELLIIYGDTYVEADLAPALNTSADGAIGVCEVEDPRRFGVVVVKDKRITGLVEKPEQPPSRLAIVGVNYIRDSEALFEALDFLMQKGIRTRGEVQLTDAFQRMVEQGKQLESFPIDGWFDCGTAETLLQTNRHLLARLGQQAVGERSSFVPPVFVDPTALVEDSVVGPNVTIAASAEVRSCVLKDSIVNEQARLTNCNLANSVIGYHAEVCWPPHQLILGDYTTIE